MSIGLDVRVVARLVAVLLIALSLTGCVSKTKAQMQARRAFLAGQRHALLEGQPSAQTTDVVFVGQVNHPVVTWTDGLTLAQAILAADYFSPENPSAIVIRRGGEEIDFPPYRLLNGEDFPLQPGDLVEMRP
jgi:hypothetical protein